MRNKKTEKQQITGAGTETSGMICM